MKLPDMVSLELGIEVNPINLIVEVHGFISVTFEDPRTLTNLMGAEELP
jgi:hypothetical protein